MFVCKTKLFYKNGTRKRQGTFSITYYLELKRLRLENKKSARGALETQNKSIIKYQSHSSSVKETNYIELTTIKKGEDRTHFKLSTESPMEYTIFCTIKLGFSVMDRSIKHIQHMLSNEIKTIDTKLPAGIVSTKIFFRGLWLFYQRNG